jgi:uncharacterized coiled-coil protein SlyX
MPPKLRTDSGRSREEASTNDAVVAEFGGQLKELNTKFKERSRQDREIKKMDDITNRFDSLQGCLKRAEDRITVLENLVKTQGQVLEKIDREK